MAKITLRLRLRRILAGILTAVLVFGLIPDMRAFADELVGNDVALSEETNESSTKQKNNDAAPLTSDNAKSGKTTSMTTDSRLQLVASMYKDEDLKEPYKEDEFKGSVKVKGNFPTSVKVCAWTESNISSDSITRISAYGIVLKEGENYWIPGEEFEVDLVDDGIKTALQEGRQLVVFHCNEEDNTATECTIKENDKQGEEEDSLRFVAKEPGVFLIGVYGEPAAQETVEETQEAIQPVEQQNASSAIQEEVVQENNPADSSADEANGIEGADAQPMASLSKKLMAANAASAAPALAAQSDGFVPIQSNTEINNAISNTKFPVYYVFDNGQVVSGSDIGMATELTSRLIDSVANLASAGADKTQFQANWRKALGITTGDVTVKRAWLNNTLQLKLAFRHAATGNVYYTTQYGTTNSDNNTNYVRNEINNNQYMLQDDDKIVVRLTLANNTKATYAADGITYGTIQNSVVKATATAFNADTFGSDYLPETVSIAGVPYTVEDDITSYTKNGVTYTLDRKNKKITSPSGPSFASLNATNNGIYVNGVRFTYSLSGQVTYKGVTYTIDTSGTDGATKATASAYRAATIGNGTVRSDVATVKNYGSTHDASVVRSVTAAIPLEKRLSSNETAANSLAALKGGKFTFSVSQDAGNPEDGASVALASDASATSTNVTITVNDVLENASSASGGLNTTYTLKDNKAPWKVTFTKAGVYKFIIHEEDTNLSGVTYDTSDKTVTFNVLEEAGSLRLVQNNRGATEQVDATQVNEAALGQLDVEHLFNTAYALGTEHRIPPTITQTGSTIVMNLNQDTSGVITTAFTFDFSRSFEVNGKMRTPDSDAVAIALHGEEFLNAYRWDCNNAIDNFHFGNGNKKDELTILRYGYVPPNTDLVQGFLLNTMTRDLDDLRGWYAYKVENNVRMPYVASSGLNGDVKNADAHYDIVPNAKSYESFDNTEEKYKNAWSDFSLKFICRDSSIGAGTLSMTVMGKTIEFNDFVASDVIGADKWQNAHFSIGSSVQDGDQGGLEFDSERYLNESIKSVSTSFWADRNNDGNYETQVNTTNSLAVPGESILVRHTIEREDETSDYFYERALVRQLVDVTSGAGITPDLSQASVVTYPVGKTNEAVAVENMSARSFNSNDLSKSMTLKVFANTKTNFEYIITAPSEAGHLVAETALFGQPPFNNIQTDSYGFKTEQIEEQLPSFANTAEVHPVCKIVDGSKTNVFFTLKDAVEFADASASGLASKDVTIQMLVPTHTITEPISAAHGNKKITITTASRSDGTYPYTGNAGTQAKLVRGYSGDSLISSTSDLEINNITMDGAKDAYTGGQVGGLLQVKKGSKNPTLTLSGGTWLTNSKLEDTGDKDNKDASGGGAVYIYDSCSLAMTGDTKIDHCTVNTNGGAIATGSKATVELDGNATIQSCEAHNLGGAIFTNNTTTLRVRGSALLGDDDPTDDVGKGNKALALGPSGNTGRGGAIHAAKSTVTVSENARILGNYAQNGGGGISVTGALSLTVDGNASIAYNRSDSEAGGIRAAMEKTGTVNLWGGSLSHNKAEKNGGGIYLSSVQAANISSGFEFSNNTSTNGDGGAICASATTLNLSNGVEIGGSATSVNRAKNGGGIALEGNATLHSPGGIVVSYNSATANGGGIYLKSDETNSLQLASGDLISNNSAKNGGGIYLTGANSVVTLNGASDASVQVQNNTASTSGGGIYIDSGVASLYGNSTVQNNAADANGGGVYLGEAGRLNVAQAATVTNNTAAQATNNVYLPGESNSMAAGIILVGGELTGTIGVYAEHTAHDGLSVATNEQFAKTDATNTTYTTDFNAVFKNDRNSQAKAVISTADTKGLEWEADAVNLTINESTDGEYADQTREFALILTSEQLRGETVETEMDGKAGTLAFDTSGKATVKLAHNKSVVLKGLAKTTSVSVASESVANYTTTYDTLIGEDAETGKTSCALIMSNEATVTVHNAMGSVPATGVLDNTGLWAAVAVGAVVLAAVLWQYRRRHAE